MSTTPREAGDVATMRERPDGRHQDSTGHLFVPLGADHHGGRNSKERTGSMTAVMLLGQVVH